MLMMVRRGERDLSQRASLRLLDCEAAAGIATIRAEVKPGPPIYRSGLRDRDLDSIPTLHVISDELSVEELEKVITENVAEMCKSRAENKLTYLKLAALYLANLHERLKAKTEDVPKRRSIDEAMPTEEAPSESVRLPPQVVSVAETLPNVHPGARDRVRDGALRAMRLAREKVSSGKGTAAGTSGSTSLPSKGSPSDPHP